MLIGSRHRWSYSYADRVHRSAVVIAITSTLALCATAQGAEADAAAAPSGPAIVAASTAVGDSASLDTVIVTATRREEKAQNVPIPIAVVGGNTLEQVGQFRFEDLNQRLPSTNVQFSNPRQTSIAVRGLGNNPANDALESSVGVYLDNVYLGRPGMANLDLIDIDQIALLRGPQGTLFGKNTTGGVLNITTRLPTFSPEAEAELSGGNYKYYQFRGAVSGPLFGDTLAGRLSVVKTHRDGFVEDVTDGRRLDGSDRKGFRGQLLFKPSDIFDLRVIGDYNEEDSDTGASVLYSPGPLLPNGTYRYFNVLAALGGHAIYDPDYRKTTINDRQHMDVRQGGGSAEANLKLGDYKLTSITAYRAWWFKPTNDADGSDLSAIVNAGQADNDDQWSQELRITSPDGRPVEWVAGAYYFYQYQSNHQYQLYGSGAGAYTGAALLNNVWSLTRQYLHTNSVSGFAQATWHATDGLSLTAGVRDTYEDKSTRIHRLPPEAPGGASPALLNFASVKAFESGELTRTDNNVSALLSAGYKLTDDVLLFVSGSRGSKSGGINPAVPPGAQPNSDVSIKSLYIEPEKATDVEAGVKSSWLDHRLVLNVNLFWTLVKDYQASSLVEVSPGIFSQALTNVGWVRTQGVETELSAIPLEGLNVALSASYNDAIYRSYRGAPCAAEQLAAGKTVCDLTNSKVVGAPKWIVNPSFNYSHPLVAELNGFVGADYSWRSWFYGTADNSQLGVVKSFGILNARLGVDGGLGDHSWEVSVWAQNLLDKHYVLGSVVTAGGLWNYSEIPGNPRTYGATFKYKF